MAETAIPAGVRFLVLGDSAVSVEFGQEIKIEINRKVMALQGCVERAVADGALSGIVETVPTYCSLMIVYDPLVLGYDELVEKLAAIIGSIRLAGEGEKQVVEIPVVYGGEYGPDLEEVAAAHGMTAEEVIRLHAAPEYPVYMLGFVAGFPYLGGMDERLATPRKKSPRLRIAAGSVGIAGGQTGIYSVESPGGWQIIGRTPLKLYDAESENPVLLSAGSYVKFKPVSEAEYKAMIK
ncbi:5-oxoprolinase subunit PxpB [Anaerovibrio sp.]|uniref:5-oxoprolinase subunit PxpB n=1 Tax=Anaerovibrio sp. TaxID=1872532 RepID=UPI003F17F1B0